MSRVGDKLTCCICGARNGSTKEPESALVRSNVRRFRQERFRLWRCGRCLSLHAADEVGLARYYEDYPFKAQKLDWVLRRFYAQLLRRMRRAGVRRSSAILDFGCGSGLLVRFLRSKGCSRAAGYDPYTDSFSDSSLLAGRYDCLVAQDVAEHVEDPVAALKSFDGLARPGGVIVIGTPNAEAIDIGRAERYVHSLHQPYHRHIWSRRALLAAAKDLGWKLDRFYSTAYTNTRIPFLNTRFMLRYLRAADNTVDAAFEQRKRSPLHLLKPGVFFDAFFGSLLDPRTEMLAVFRRP